MPARPARFGLSNPGEPVVHQLPPIRYRGEEVGVRLLVRRLEDSSWRARLVFGDGEVDVAPATAEIFFAKHEMELWEAVNGLREHHLCDLFRSLTEE